MKKTTVSKSVIKKITILSVCYLIINLSVPIHAQTKPVYTNKLRVLVLTDIENEPDDAGPWIRNTFRNLFYIVSPGSQENSTDSYYYATWIGISGEQHYHYLSGANKYIVGKKWVDQHIQLNHGPLGTQYPDISCIMEGDSLSFLYLINNGLNTPEHPDSGSWGGRYEFYKPHIRLFCYAPETRAFCTNAEDMVIVDNIYYINPQATIWRWRTHFQNDFAARMDWCVKSYHDANHPPVVKLNHANRLIKHSNDTIFLNASASSDPDGNELFYEWIYYREAGTFPSRLLLHDNHKSKISLSAPNVSKHVSLHFIVSVTDDGDPALTRYQRVIFKVFPKK